VRKINTPGLGPGDTRGGTEMPDHFIARSAKVSGAPFKRGDLGASPSLAVTFKPLNAKQPCG